MIRFALPALLILFGTPLFASPAVWLEDLAAAQKASATSGKPILVDMTGSDWCPPCIQMEEEVFSQPEFSAVSAKYVLLRLDYPRSTWQAEKTKAQNKRLAEVYTFEGFPTYLLMDAQGALYAQHTGYVEGGVAGFARLLAGLEPQRATLAMLTESLKKSSPGAARAQAQDALFRQAEAWGLTAQYGDLPLKIVADDKDGKAGLKARYQVYNAYQRLLATWSELPDFHRAIDELTALATRAAAWPDLQQKILFTKGMVWMNALDDEIQARSAFQQVRAMDPKTTTGLRAIELLDQLP